MNIPQRLEEMRKEWDNHCKEDFDTRNGYSDWWTSHFSTLLDEIVDEIIPEKQKIGPYSEGDSNYSLWLIVEGFNSCLTTIKANLEKLKQDATSK